MGLVSRVARLPGSEASRAIQDPISRTTTTSGSELRSRVVNMGASEEALVSAATVAAAVACCVWPLASPAATDLVTAVACPFPFPLPLS